MWYSVGNWEYQNGSKDFKLGEVVVQYGPGMGYVVLRGRPQGLLFGICGHGAWLTSGQWVRTQDHFLSFLSQPAYSSALVTSAHLSSAQIQHSSDGRQKRQASS